MYREVVFLHSCVHGIARFSDVVQICFYDFKIVKSIVEAFQLFRDFCRLSDRLSS